MIHLDKLMEIAALRGEEACVFYKNKIYSWNEMVRQVQLKISFLRINFEEGELHSVSYLSKNNFEIICWISAFSTLGIPVNGLDYSLPIDSLKEILSKVKPKLLLVSFDLYTKSELNKLNTSEIITLSLDSPIDSVVTSIGMACKDKAENLCTYIRPPFKAISLTSGTSSLPKVVIRYKSFDQRRFSWFIERFNFTQNDGFMLILPLYHAAGNGWARMFMGIGAPIYLVDQSNDVEILNALQLGSIKTTVLTPNLVRKLINLKNNHPYIHYLRWALVGGNYFSIKTKAEAREAFGNIFCEYYGCTETGVNVLADMEDMRDFPESVGKPFSGNEVIILSETNTPLKDKEIGKVAISSYMLMDEYGDHEKPFLSINNKNYFIMADHGYLDKGRLFLINRNNGQTKDKIYLLEENIRDLSFIDDVAITASELNGKWSIRCIFSVKENFGMKNELLNEVYLKANEMGIENFTAKNVDKIPYSPSGKTRYNKIQQIFEQKTI